MRAWAVLAWGLLLALSAAAKTPEPPKISEVSADYNQLVVTFDQPMLTWNQGGLLAAIQVQPALTCRWVWDDDTTLQCRIPRMLPPLRPASTYRLTIGAGLWSQAGVAMPAQTRVVETRRPELMASADAWNAGVPHVVVGSQDEVTAEAIAKVVSVDLDGQPLRSQFVPIADDFVGWPRHRWELRLPSLPTRAGLLHVRVHPGLVGSAGPLPGTQDEVLLTAAVHEPFRLRQVVCGPGYVTQPVAAVAGKPVALACEPGKVIGLYFSRKPDAAAIAAIGAALPAGLTLVAPQDVSSDWAWVQEADAKCDCPHLVRARATAIYLNSTLAATRLRWSLPAGLHAVDGSILDDAPAIDLRLGDYPSSFDLKPRVLVAATGSERLPTLVTRNTHASFQIEQLAVGATAQRSSASVATGSQRNALQPAQLPPVPAAIREHGGIVFAGATNQRDLGYALAFAPFTVLASVARDQLLVWATSRDGLQPLAGARVELLSVTRDGQMQTLAEASAGPDGVAQLQMPPAVEETATSIPPLVRVTEAGQQSLVPISRQRYGATPALFDRHAHRADGQPWSDFEEGQAHSFGVSEQPLYRPGETVQYRLWYRRRVGNRLQRTAAGPVQVELRALGRYRRLQRWSAALDEQGSVAGSLHLPALLPDDEYCIDVNGAEEVSSEEDGVCFQVARFQAQAMWAQLQADHTQVLAGGELRLSLDAGYFSGDAAAHVATHFSGVLVPQRVEDAYPAFSAYTFMAPFQGDTGHLGAKLLTDAVLPTTTDGQGKAHVDLHLPAQIDAQGPPGHPIVFGQMRLNASVFVPGKPSASSGTVHVRYAQYPFYVGLKTTGGWLPLDRDPILEAVIVSHDGHAQNGQTVQVSIERVDKDQDAQAKPLAQCQVRVEAATPCAFRAPEPGLYRFRAQADGAAPTVLERWIGGRAPVTPDAQKPHASLTLLHDVAAGAPAQVELRQPYAHARVLFAIEYDRVVQHWVQDVTSAPTTVAVPLRPDWAPGVSLHAVILPLDPAAAGADRDARSLDAVLDLDIPSPATAAITVTPAKSRLQPGQTLLLHLANPGGGTRHATIAVVDDSTYQQATDVTAMADPARDGWLGAMRSWEGPAWFGLEAWTRVDNPFYQMHPGAAGQVVPKKPTPLGEIDRIEVIGSRVAPVAETEPDRPVTALTRADIRDSGLVTTFDVLNRIGRGEGSGLQTRAAGGAARLRGTFVDAAYWNADLVLAAGERRDLSIRLPDNLTRWRVLVWTSDAEDGFALCQATVETALPVELRTGAPARLYVGDRASASVSARNHARTPARLALAIQAGGAGVQLARRKTAPVAANAELSQAIAFAPELPGVVSIRARAGDAHGGDALDVGVPVRAPVGEEKRTQAGWVDADDLDLPLPTLPADARAPVLEVQVERGLSGWRRDWLRSLREYPHRCWEQTLSRALGAALAIDAGVDRSQWPEARQVVDDALTVAPMFQDEDGGFRYFLTDSGEWSGSASPFLSAYTLRGFELLEQLGYQPPLLAAEDLTAAMQKTLRAVHDDPRQHGTDESLEAAAQAAGGLLAPKLLDDGALTVLWQHWDRLSWYGRSELVRGLARKPAFAAQYAAGIERLRAAGSQRGLRRVIHDPRDFSAGMGSDLRDQCGVVAALFALDHDPAGAAARRSLLRGLQDLYAGGTASLDTQASAQCLIALHAAASALPAEDQAWTVQATLGAQQHTLTLAPGQQQAQWQVSLATGRSADALRLHSQIPASASLSYTAQLRYGSDLRQAPAQAVGMHLTRSYQVLRDGAWKDLATAGLHAGDWVRVKLELDVPAWRHFVAITDVVPGGLVSRDITLSGVGGAQLRDLADSGSWWFDSRQTGANDVRLYAEQLPPGEHAVYYYAQAVHPGTYLAPPASAELMYGRASRSTTASARITIDAGAGRAQTRKH